MKLHEVSVKRPVAVTMIVLIFVVIGAYSLSMLKMDMMPKMEMSMAIVYTSYPNVGSEEVENLVTKTIESSVAAVSGIDTIQSQSSEGTSMTMISFKNDTDMNQAVIDLKDKIDLVRDYLPEDATDPVVMKLDTSMMPVSVMSVTYEGYDLVKTKQYIDDNLKNKLEAISGVASVNVSGAQDRVIEVEVDPQKVFGYNLSMQSITAAISAQNQNLPSGSTEAMDKKMSVRTTGKFNKVSDIDFVPLVTPSGQVLYLKDIAKINDTYTDITTTSRLNGENALMISISKESDANTVDVVNEILSILESTKKSNPKFNYEVTMEQGTYIENAIGSVTQNAITGAILAVLVLLLFLGSIRNSLVIGIAMPISIVTTFIGMYFSGMTLNIVSLGGLSLGVGMLVDNSVVVLENIFRRRDKFGENPKDAAISGTGEVIGAVVASVLTTCIVYVPILFIDNIMAVMFKQLAFAIIFSQIASLLTTFLLVPMLCSKIPTKEKRNPLGDKIMHPFEVFINKLYVVYEKTLRKCLSHRKATIAIVLGAFVLSLVVLSQLGMTLMPSSDEGTLTVSIELPEGSKLENTDNITKQIENIIRDNENVKSVFSNVGSGGEMSMLGATSTNTSSITVTLNDDRSLTTNDVINELRNSEISNITGAEITMQAANSSMQSMSSDEVQYEFSGTNDLELTNYVNQAKELLSNINGIVETSTSLSNTKSEIRINVDTSKAARYGLSASTVSGLVKPVIASTSAGRYTEHGSEYDINIVYPEKYVKNYNELKNLQIKASNGQWISLSDIADVTIDQGSTTLMRKDQKRVLTLTGKFYGTDMGSVNREFEKQISTLQAPSGVTRDTGGSFQIMIDAMKSLLIAILLGIVLMYLVMCAQFENMKHPFIILFTIPLALIGVVISLSIARSPLSVVGCIGILMLTGIIVNNAIVLIDFISSAKKENPEMDMIEVMVYAGKSRMRPILMTSLTSVLGFLPMAISTGEGSEMMQPLAVVLLGGLFIGTFLTLLFIPTIYISFIKRAERKREKKLLKRQKKNIVLQ